jgi:hypothetical protein
MRKNYGSVLIVATLPTMMLTGCGAIGGAKLQPVNLPDPPECMAPVAVPVIETGMDARSALARNRAALRAANGRLECSRDWYVSVKEDYAKQ